MTPITEQHRKAAAEVADYIDDSADYGWNPEAGGWERDKISIDAIAAILARWWPEPEFRMLPPAHAWADLNEAQRRQIQKEHIRPPGDYDQWRWMSLGAESWARVPPMPPLNTEPAPARGRRKG
jgi:hypothetical protein